VSVSFLGADLATSPARPRVRDYRDYRG
jgi:hypothetical protein